ncbi:PadR family transcriptional regulator [Bailinhaonella thermotolerans]|uniref:PadR family transcriptional regulator n=1 Tax=Bailinhaonella thermotolerans TaxID=1070861 RepID=A0A3A4A150_9ACTN|nr:PadR family transcriptional regulator [Bailinhaonella thermotolerans]RJL20700.1 PadR family transcriptional regulator [Bailinhaonella thermotolerans]
MERSGTSGAEAGSGPGAAAESGPGRLPPTAWAVLGILSFGEELTGYEVRRWADHILRFFYWSPAMSQIYRELKTLERAGYAASRVETAADGRPRRVYAITEDGVAALARWVAREDVGPPVFKNGTALRVWLGHLTTPDRLREVVTAYRDETERLGAQAEHSRSVAAEVPGWAHPELVARWAARYYESERALAEGMLADLAALDAPRLTS